MLEVEKLFSLYGESNKFVTGDANHKKILIKNKMICNDTLKPLIESFNYLFKLGYNGCLKIYFDAESFADDSIINVIEALLYYSISIKHINIKKVHFKKLKRNVRSIYYDAYLKSLLFIKEELDYSKELVKNFELQRKIGKGIFRINSSSFKKKNFGEIQDEVYSDIYVFLLGEGLEEKQAYLISTTCVELIDNSFSHAEKDVILSLKHIQALDLYNNEKKCILITVFNVSDVFLGGKLKDSFYNKTLNNYSYNTIEKAYNNCKKYINEEFNEEAFFMVSSFQKNVTSRDRQKSGTGLTNMLDLLIGMAEISDCYVISNNHVLRFNKEFLLINSDGTIGFNESNSYFDDIPSKECYQSVQNPFCGTLYGLTLVVDNRR